MRKIQVIHPFLFALFPVIFLFSQNVRSYEIRVVFLPAAAVLILAAILWKLLTLIFKDSRKSALIVSPFFLLFFSYGHVYESLADVSLVTWFIGRNIFLTIVLGCLFLLWSYFCARLSDKLDELTKLFNIMAACLVITPLITVAGYGLQTRGAEDKNRTPQESQAAPLRENALLPDIYYIVPDGYARSDILSEVFGHNNSEFINYLKQKEFYVAEKSRSNYWWTVFSFTCTLNFDYIENVVDPLALKTNDNNSLMGHIHNSRIFKLIRQNNYKTVAFSSGCYATELKEADQYIRENSSIIEQFFRDDFQEGLLNTTPLFQLMRGVGHDLWRKRILNAFDKLPQPLDRERPVFVFAHILACHSPFVFDNKGEKVSDFSGNYAQRYKNQLIFVTEKLKKSIDGIFAQRSGERPLVIVLQSDHGDSVSEGERCVRERFCNLSAIYFSDRNYKDLYKTITPVNIFRIIANRYFGTAYPLLEEKSYFSEKEDEFVFREVTFRDGNL